MNTETFHCCFLSPFSNIEHYTSLFSRPFQSSCSASPPFFFTFYFYRAIRISHSSTLSCLYVYKKTKMQQFMSLKKKKQSYSNWTLRVYSLTSMPYKKRTNKTVAVTRRQLSIMCQARMNNITMTVKRWCPHLKDKIMVTGSRDKRNTVHKVYLASLARQATNLCFFWSPVLSCRHASSVC